MSVYLRSWYSVALRPQPLLAPRGMAPDVIPVTAALAAWPLLLGAIMLQISKLLVERQSIYEPHTLKREFRSAGKVDIWTT